MKKKFQELVNLYFVHQHGILKQKFSELTTEQKYRFIDFVEAPYKINNILDDRDRSDIYKLLLKNELIKK